MTGFHHWEYRAREMSLSRLLHELEASLRSLMAVRWQTVTSMKISSLEKFALFRRCVKSLDHRHTGADNVAPNQCRREPKCLPGESSYIGINLPISRIVHFYYMHVKASMYAFTGL